MGEREKRRWYPGCDDVCIILDGTNQANETIKTDKIRKRKIGG
jgi:hypothetical protein